MNPMQALTDQAQANAAARAADGPPTLYKIVTYQFNGPRRVVERGLTLDEAQAHCQRDDTHGEGWFDGYEIDEEGEGWL